MDEWVLSLCDESGIMVQPWADAGYRCICVDLSTKGERRDGLVTYIGADIRAYLPPLRSYAIVFAFPPCTDTAVSGAKHFRRKGLARLVEALEVVESCRRICEWSETAWMLENPVSTVSTYWREPDFTFNPSDYAGYPGGENDTYPKRTCLWAGNGFQMPHAKPLPQTDTRIHSMGPGTGTIAAEKQDARGICKGSVRGQRKQDAAAQSGVRVFQERGGRIGMSGAELITAERQRQQDVEGWTPEHDDGHIDTEMADAARVYTWVAKCEVLFGANAGDFRVVPNDWPSQWDRSWFKPSSDPIRNLVRAGALIAAEIDRLQRAAQPVGTAKPDSEGK